MRYLEWFGESLKVHSFHLYLASMNQLQENQNKNEGIMKNFALRKLRNSHPHTGVNFPPYGKIHQGNCTLVPSNPTVHCFLYLQLRAMPSGIVEVK